MLLTEKYPKLVSHMQQCNYQLDLIAFQWLVTLFFNSLGPDAMQFVFSAFLLKGQKIIIKTALMIIDYFVNDIIKAQQFDEIWNIINN